MSSELTAVHPAGGVLGEVLLVLGLGANLADWWSRRELEGAGEQEEQLVKEQELGKEQDTGFSQTSQKYVRPLSSSARCRSHWSSCSGCWDSHETWGKGVSQEPGDLGG